MMTVRFSTGFSIQYNTAGYIKRFDKFVDLYTRENGTWIAQVPNDAVIESVPACRTYMAAEQTAWDRVAELSREVRLLKNNVAKLAREKKG